MLRKIVQPFYVVYVAIVFLTGLLITFLLCLINSIGNRPGTRKVFFAIVSCWARTTAWIAGMPVRVSGKPEGGRYVVVANHISYVDTVNVYGCGADYFRPLAKKEMSTLPVFGFLYKQAAIMVDRSSPHSRALSMRLMRRFLKREGNIFMFPEGTFNETGNPLKEFYDGAFRLAISTQTPILPMVFPDTLERWHYGTWQVTPGRNRAIYLPPVPVTGLEMDDLPRLKQQVYTLMENAIIKYRGL